MKNTQNIEDMISDKRLLAVLRNEIRVCEGIALDIPVSGIHKNAFGRPVRFESADQLSSLAGMAMSGLRCSALININQLKLNFNLISDLSRNLVPVTFVVLYEQSENTAVTIHGELFNSGVIQLFSAGPEKAASEMLLAHRISEYCLCPVVIHMGLPGNEATELQLPELKKAYPGQPDDRIPCPTPAQEMIFGRNRRLVPQWYSLDTLGTMNVGKTEHQRNYEIAAQREYMGTAVTGLIDSAIRDSASELTIYRHLYHKNNRLILSTGLGDLIIQSLQDLISTEKLGLDLMDVRIWHSRTPEQLADIINKYKYVQVLTPVNSNTSREIPDSIKAVSGTKTEVLSANIFSTELSVLSLAARDLAGKVPSEGKYFGIRFTDNKSDYPRHLVMKQEIARNYPELSEKGISDELEASANIPADASTSKIARKYADLGSPFSRLSRFGASTAGFFTTRHKESIADPFQAVPYSPPSASALQVPSLADRKLPVIDNRACTACGKCLTECPYTALPSSANTPEQILQTALDMVSAEGFQVIGFIPLVRPFAESLRAVFVEKDKEFSGCLDEAWSELKSKKNFDDDKLETLELEYERIRDVASKLDPVRSDVFYHDTEQIQKGSGELFNIFIDASACTGCGICVEICPENAIDMQVDSPELLEAFSGKLNVWENLPDTSADTINRVLNDESRDPFADLMLSRNFYHTVLGGDADERGINRRKLVHMITALAESMVQPSYSVVLGKLEELISSMSGNIHKILSDALPSEDFENIRESLSSSNGDHMPLETLIKEAGGATQGVRLDRKELQRKIDLLTSLRAFRKSLLTGPSGTGRARMALVYSAGEYDTWASAYPLNPFVSPVLMTGEGFDLSVVRGLYLGQSRFILDNIKLIRQAELEAKNKYVPGIHDAEIASMELTDLTEQEAGLLPPVLLFGDAGNMNISELVNEPLPFKVFMFDDPVQSGEINDLIGLFLRNPAIYTAQVNPFYKRFMFETIRESLAAKGPGIISLYCPEETGNGNTHLLEELVSDARVFPSFRFDPRRYEGFIQGGLELSPEMDSESLWKNLELQDKDQKKTSFTLTWADLAFTSSTWKPFFRESVENETNTSPVFDHINDPGAQSVPVIYRENEKGLTSHVVDLELIRRTRSFMQYWHTLRELAGLSTSQPQKLTDAIRKELSQKYDAEIAELKRDYEEKLREQETIQKENLRRKLRDRLVELANRKNQQ